MSEVNWGRPGTMGPDQPHWPEAAHAASEINDDDEGELMGGGFVAAVVIVGLTAAAALIGWAIWSAW
jgi:hypothetical protein